MLNNFAKLWLQICGIPLNKLRSCQYWVDISLVSFSKALAMKRVAAKCVRHLFTHQHKGLLRSIGYLKVNAKSTSIKFPRSLLLKRHHAKGTTSKLSYKNASGRRNRHLSQKISSNNKRMLARVLGIVNLICWVCIFYLTCVTVCEWPCVFPQNNIPSHTALFWMIRLLTEKGITALLHILVIKFGPHGLIFVPTKEKESLSNIFASVNEAISHHRKII